MAIYCSVCNIEVTDNGEAVECDECQVNEAYILERVQALGGISRSRYGVITTKSVHRLQICPILHN